MPDWVWILVFLLLLAALLMLFLWLTGMTRSALMRGRNPLPSSPEQASLPTDDGHADDVRAVDDAPSPAQPEKPVARRRPPPQRRSKPPPALAGAVTWQGETLPASVSPTGGPSAPAPSASAPRSRSGVPPPAAAWSNPNPDGTSD